MPSSSLTCGSYMHSSVVSVVATPWSRSARQRFCASGVDGGAADDAQPSEVGVGRVGVGEVGQRDDDRRVLGVVLGEVVGVGAAPSPGSASGRGSPSRRRSRPRSPAARRAPPRSTPSRARGTTRASCRLLRRVGDDEEAHRLPVAALRAEAGRLDRVVEDLGRHRIGEVVAAGVRRPHGVGELHGETSRDRSAH